VGYDHKWIVTKEKRRVIVKEGKQVFGDYNCSNDLSHRWEVFYSDSIGRLSQAAHSMRDIFRRLINLYK